MAAAPDQDRVLHQHAIPAEQSAIRSLKLSPFDPSKPDTYKAWETSFLAGLSSSTAAAIQLGKLPSYEQVASTMGPNSTEEQIGSVLLGMHEAYDEGEVEAYSCAGRVNPADPFTKYVDYETWRKAMYYVTNDPAFHK